MPVLHTPAPDFTRPAVPSHRPIRLSTFRGKVVLLNFWATWCGPCLAEIPRLAKWQNRLGAQGLQVIGVSMDDEEADVVKWIQKLNLPYPIVMSDARLSLRYGGVLGLPMSFLIDRHGMLRQRFEGPLDASLSKHRLPQLLQE